MPGDIAASLDAWIASRPEPRPSRSDAIRSGLRDWLTSHGFLKPGPLDHAATAEKIAELDATAASLKHDGTPSPANALKKMKCAVAKNEATKLRTKLARAKNVKTGK